MAKSTTKSTTKSSSTTRKTTTTRSSATPKPTTSKPATKPPAAAKPTLSAVPAAAPAAAAKPAAGASVAPLALRKKALIDRVVARSGIKKKDAKPVVEAMLAVLGEALAEGEDMNLQPLGKVMVKREKEQPNAKIMICRIRQARPVKSRPKDPLAKADEGR